MLDRIDSPADLRELSDNDLKQLAAELRFETVDTVSQTGGHLGASLGVIELTVALHAVFETPHDRLIWDVSHQAYPHKILTGRRSGMRTLRQGGGLSGFTPRVESPYDPFGAAHSSTSISAALGMGRGRPASRREQAVHRRDRRRRHDGRMAYEAMNNAGAMELPLVVVLNDNDMSIAPNVGAMSNYLARLISSRSYRSLRQVAKEVARRFPKPFEIAALRAEEYARGLVTGGTLFEEMGFYYVGPIAATISTICCPSCACRRHGRARAGADPCGHAEGQGLRAGGNLRRQVSRRFQFDLDTGVQAKSKPAAPSYTSVFAKSLIAEAERDPAVCAITAAMPSGTGVDAFGARFPDRAFDVGIAEQHAVTFAAGLACEGMKPFAAIYSTFLQRGYDQVVHDVAIQSLPVRFAIDRAGYVGADGATHCGAFDIAYLGCLPNFVLMAAADEADLVHMVATAVSIDDGPAPFACTRGGRRRRSARARRGPGARQGADRTRRREGGHPSYGARLHDALAAAERLETEGISTTVADARFAKPLDEDLVRRLAENHELLLTVEEGSVGGFGAFVLQFLAGRGLLDGGLKVRSLVMPDIFIDHDKPEAQVTQAGLDTDAIFRTVFAAFGPAPVAAVG